MAYTISYMPTNSNATRARRYFVADTAAELPTTAPAVDGDIGYAKDTDLFYSYNGTSWAAAITGVAWGTITGTLSSQTDLQAALDAKQAASDLALSKLAPASNVTITAGYSAYVSPFYEFVSGVTTEIGAGSTLEIG